VIVINSNQLSRFALPTQKEKDLVFDNTTFRDNFQHYQSNNTAGTPSSTTNNSLIQQFTSNLALRNFPNNTFKYHLSKVASNAVEQYETLANLEKLQARDKILGIREVV